MTDKRKYLVRKEKYGDLARTCCSEAHGSLSLRTTGPGCDPPHGRGCGRGQPQAPLMCLRHRQLSSPSWQTARAGWGTRSSQGTLRYSQSESEQKEDGKHYMEM